MPLAKRVHLSDVHGAAGIIAEAPLTFEIFSSWQANFGSSQSGWKSIDQFHVDEIRPYSTYCLSCCIAKRTVSRNGADSSIGGISLPHG